MERGGPSAPPTPPPAPVTVGPNGEFKPADSDCEAAPTGPLKMPLPHGYQLPRRLDSVQDVDIAEGTYKYVLLLYMAPGEAKIVVRSYESTHYHGEAVALASNEIGRMDSAISSPVVIAGGRIELNSRDKTVRVYGRSKTYERHGKCKGANEYAAMLIAKAMPGYDVKWSDDGY